MEHTTIAVDLAKAVFQVAISHQPGRVDEERRLARDRFLEFFAQRPPATVILEACGSAHDWARQLQPLGHSVRLLAPHDVRPYVRRNKTDRTDAKGLLEANRNEEIHAVPVKSVAHQAIASLHCRRSTWLATRTSRITTIRGLLREFGLFIPVGAHHVVPPVRTLLVDPTAVPGLLHSTLAAACDDIDALETQMRATERRLDAVAADMPDVTLLQTVPGIGLITATALVARVTDIRRFRSGRHFASYIGLTPREDSTGSRRRLGAISKPGDVYVRMLLTHGARSVLWPREDREIPDRVTALGAPHRATARSQCRGRGRGEHTRADCRGGLGARAAVRSRSRRRLTRSRSSVEVQTQELHRVPASWRTGRTGAGPRRYLGWP
jgi:transposase